jgi:capsular polysaccharide export protein
MQQRKTAVWTVSFGILNNNQLRSFFPESYIQKIKPWPKRNSLDIVVGWGKKPNTLKAQAFAKKHSLTYVHLEDGFIGYLGHPSTDDKRLSLIKDNMGIYYDARNPSRLEQLCLDISTSVSAGSASESVSFSSADVERANCLVAAITSSGISKYNHIRESLPANIQSLGSDCILVVDQTAGDQSIECGLATAESFQQMLGTAIATHPDKKIIIKTHPDVLIAGKKSGHFSPDSLPVSNPQADSNSRYNNVYLLTDDCSVSDLMAKVSDVYVVTSQLGFEALMYGKRVHCFGMPFYAGWGLTQDQLVCERRTTHSSTLTLPQLFFASLIQYPTYLHPETQTLCEVEEVVDWLTLQLGAGDHNAADVCYAVGFSLWKQAFVKQFVGRMSKKVVFINDESKLETLLQQPNQRETDLGSTELKASVLLWGRSRSAWAKELHKYADVWFMEDGFLRSVGLGADLRRPSCLVIDYQGMYYDSSAPSDIINILNNIDLVPAQMMRAEMLIERIKQQSVTKYNVGIRHDVAELLTDLRCRAAGREVVVVPGQFENDLSIACSLGEIKTNIGLLAKVREDYPGAFIIFKEHPDVYSGVRLGALGDKAALEFADLYLADIDMDSLLTCCDRLCTLTSLAGFEALLRNKSVSVYGSPFYAGWGLTDDKLVLPSRYKSLTLNELVYGAMIEYSRYVDWNTGYLTGPEQTVQFLAEQRSSSGIEQLKSSWFARQLRKIHYFIDTLFH